ncbi:LysE family translocator [Paraburkholderia solisilvae]|nr:LysE family translocator [Paraburkholderia solisilvae]
MITFVQGIASTLPEQRRIILSWGNQAHSSGRAAVAFSVLMVFWAVSLSLVIVPGPDWAYAISAGMHDRAIAPAVAGMLSGYLTITLAVAVGIGALVASVPALLTVLTFVGAGYLLWLGGNIVARPSVPTVADGHASSTTLGWAIRGFAISGANPKALLLFLAMLPQFTCRDGAWSISAQIGAMGLVQILNCAVVYSLVGVGARIVLRTRPKVAHMVSQFFWGGHDCRCLSLIERAVFGIQTIGGKAKSVTSFNLSRGFGGLLCQLSNTIPKSASHTFV